MSSAVTIRFQMIPQVQQEVLNPILVQFVGRHQSNLTEVDIHPGWGLASIPGREFSIGIRGPEETFTTRIADFAWEGESHEHGTLRCGYSLTLPAGLPGKISGPFSKCLLAALEQMVVFERHHKH